MGFNSTSAGGLMGMDFIALPTMATVGDALARVREFPLLQPEALTSVHAVDDDGCLRGVLEATLPEDWRRREAAGHPARGRPLTASGTFTHESIGDGLFG